MQYNISLSSVHCRKIRKGYFLRLNITWVSKFHFAGLWLLNTQIKSKSASTECKLILASVLTRSWSLTFRGTAQNTAGLSRAGHRKGFNKSELHSSWKWCRTGLYTDQESSAEISVCSQLVLWHQEGNGQHIWVLREFGNDMLLILILILYYIISLIN